MTEPNQKIQQSEKPGQSNKPVESGKPGQQAMGQGKGPQPQDPKGQPGQKVQASEPSKPDAKNDPHAQKAYGEKSETPKHMGAPKP